MTILVNEFTLQDVNIIPKELSKVKSRKEVNLNYKYDKLPIISSPMAYFSHLNAIYLKNKNPEDLFFVYTLPRISPNKNLLIESLKRIYKEYEMLNNEEIEEFRSFLKFLIKEKIIPFNNEKEFFYYDFIEVFKTFYKQHLNYFDIDVRINAAKLLRQEKIPFIPSISLKDFYNKDKKEKMIELVILSNTDYYLIDVANGYMEEIIKVIKFLEKYTTKTPIFGNIISGDILYDYRFEGINKLGIRIGIGNGSQCLTTVTTGIGRPQFSALFEVYNTALEVFSNKENITLINDGGVRGYSDIAVALLFSDFIMTNYLFKGSELNIHRIFSIKNEKVISYGMASKYAKLKDDGYIEGDITYSNRIDISTIRNNIVSSLQSTLSYVGCKDIKEYDYANLKDRIALTLNSSISMKNQAGLKE